MNLTGNTILITGGGSGIGQALAEKFHANGNKVIITGRNQEKLDKVTSSNPGIESMILDISDPEAIIKFAETVKNTHPDLNVVIHNAGIMTTEKIGETDISVAENEIITNLLGPIRLNTALLPLLLDKEEATIVTVSSGLGFLPLSLNPTYSATKAAIHSYTQSLRYQLKDSSVKVIELIPPYLRTSLAGERQANDPTAMPLDEYITEVWAILEQNPDIDEVIVERVKMLRTAESSGEYNTRYKNFNEAMIKARSS
jgi:uncharacterized oxidoreductase